MPTFLSKRHPIGKGSIALTELLAWGLPFTAILAFIGFAFAVLQLGEPSNDEFWIARGFFLLAATVGLARIVLWGLTTSRAMTIRLAVGIIACGFIVPFTVEAIRYVNRRNARWLQKQPEIEKGSIPPLVLSKAKTEPEPAPNADAEQPSRVLSVRDLGEPLIKGSIKELYFYQQSIGIIQTVFTVLKVHIENDGADTKIQDFRFTLFFYNEEYPGTAKPSTLFRLVHRGQGMADDQLVDLQDSNSEPLRRHFPKDGWLCFQGGNLPVSDLSTVISKITIRLDVIDGVGEPHSIQQPALSIPSRGELEYLGS